jgi:DedD protein
MFKQKRDSAPDKPRIEPADAVQQARTRARQRLIGAIVLLAIGIIGFPLVFETQPRPIPVDVPIEIPRRDAQPPLAMPPPRPTATRPPAPLSEPATPTEGAPAAAATRTAPAAARGSDGAITESGSDTARDSSVSRATAPVETPRRAASAAVVATAAPSSAARSVDGERARALLEGRPASSADEQRFVVQVGAFADAEAARETRKNVEKLGLKTYTQVAQTSAGNRIRVRVGPFTTRGEAEAALAKAKAAGVNAVLLTL